MRNSFFNLFFKSFLIYILCIIVFNPAYSQNKKKGLLRDGNRSYYNNNYVDAEVNFKKALEIDTSYDKAQFNLANSYYKQGKYDEASRNFSELTQKNLDKKTIADSYYNLGNSLYKSNKLQESVEAYKNCLRNNPNDMDAKHNLQFVRQMLAQQQNQNKNKQDQNKQDQNKQDQNKQDQNKQDQNKQDQNKQDQNKQDQNKQDQNKQQQPKDEKISKQDAERMLNAINGEDKKLQKQLKKKLKGTKSKSQKQW